MADWSIKIKACPCEDFRQAGHDAVAAGVPVEEQQRANALVILLEQTVQQVARGQQNTRYGATVRRSRTLRGQERLSIAVTATPTPAEA